MKSNSQLDLPSEYYIDSIVIKSKITEDELDVSNIYNSIVIHEGITYNFIYGSISIFDTNGFIESLPIVGEEEISFKIKKKMTDEKYFEVKGNIYSIATILCDVIGIMRQGSGEHSRRGLRYQCRWSRSMYQG